MPVTHPVARVASCHRLSSQRMSCSLHCAAGKLPPAGFTRNSDSPGIVSPGIVPVRAQIAYHRAYAEHRAREGLGDELQGLHSPEQFPSRLCNLLLQVHMYISCLVPTCCSGTLEALGQHPSGAALVLVSYQHRSTPARCTTCPTGCALCRDPCQLA